MPKRFEKRRAGEMRRLPLRLADAEIDRRLAEIDRHQLPVHVGDVQQRDVAERLEGEKLVLRQPLLRQCARHVARQNGGRRGRDLQEFAARDHAVS